MLVHESAVESLKEEKASRLLLDRHDQRLVKCSPYSAVESVPTDAGLSQPQ